MIHQHGGAKIPLEIPLMKMRSERDSYDRAHYHHEMYLQLDAAAVYRFGELLRGDDCHAADNPCSNATHSQPPPTGAQWQSHRLD